MNDLLHSTVKMGEERREEREGEEGRRDEGEGERGGCVSSHNKTADISFFVSVQVTIRFVHLGLWVGGGGVGAAL